MQQFFGNFGSFWETVCEPDICPVLEMEIADFGGDEGIDVVMRVDQPNRLIFAVILADPESHLLLTDGCVETQTFWRCIRKHVNDEGIKQLFLTARCNSILRVPHKPNLMS